MIRADRLTETFLWLTRFDAESYHERKIADALKEWFAAMGMTAEEAEAGTLRFLADSWEHGVPKICIITGKGIHSQDGIPVVKEMVESVLHGSPYVREYASPKARYGGSGALWIILKEKA